MRKRFICFVLSAMLVLTFIPQITLAAEGDEESKAVNAEVPTQAQTEEIPAEAAQSGTITGFVPLETSEYYYEGNPDEGELTVNLPEYLSVYLNGGTQPCDIPVTWEAVEDFDDTDFYFYSMRPVWSSDFVLSKSLSSVLDVPWITVYKQEPENRSIEPVVTEDEAQPLYTEEDGVIDPQTGLNDDAGAFSLKDFASETAGNLFACFAEDAYADTATNTAAIYKYLTGTMGLNMAAACGVMININAESAMSPINLQNTYNTRFGLSDSEYTKAVDKGKGSYKTSSGKSQNFKTDSGGYGLCQWTSSGRKTNLLNRALNSGKSIGDINMQLTHLNNELQSYPQVLTTLQKVPNNAAGAYIAAAEFCLSFEIPANTINTAASRGKNCLSNYWKTYSGSSASASGTSFISLCGYSYPTAVKEGKGMDVTGYVVSNYNISSITCKILNKNGNAVYSSTVKPGTTACKLSKLDDAMKFSKLSTGTYTYVITATDSSGKSVKATHKFSVKSSGSTTKALGFATAGSNASTDTSEEEPTQPTTSPTQPTQPTTSPTQPTTSPTDSKQTYSGTFPKLPKRGYFKKGDKGKQVKYLQKFLKWYGYSITVDGKYKSKTIKAVKDFQKNVVGQKANGYFGKKALNKAKTVKK